MVATASRMRRQQLIFDSCCSQRSNLRLQDLPQFRQMREPFLLSDPAHQVERLPDRLRGSVRDEGSAPRVGFHQAFFAQRLDGFAHCRAAHAEVLGQFAFRRELIPGFSAPFRIDSSIC